jgi:dTDP-glucose 4,6-dehydratase
VSKVVVIGGNSFSGSNTIRTLLKNGFEVLSFGRSEELDIPFNPYKKLVTKNNFRFERGRLNDEDQSISLEITRFKPKIVLNFAAQSMVAESWQKSEDWYEANVVGIAKLANELKHLTSIEKFIQFTTPEVYGTTNNWIKESFSFNPTTPYAVSRAAGDLHLKCMFETLGFPVIFTRAANVYGPCQKLYRIIPRTILATYGGEKLPLQGNGQSIRSFIHIEDTVNALLRILEDGVIGDSYHISSNELISIVGLIGIIAGRRGLQIADFTVKAPERPGKDQAYKLDSSHIRQTLNWKDSIPLSQGVSDTISWIEDNLELLLKLPTNYQHKR